ncbi:hypothetical protein JET18_14885 [Chryseobacterium sp. L7]|uniref:DUF4238 domain-containing protein n=1 Tax=Chryseobacterium endalhagicum TaxID=2797638 RepID=A0ABS1QHR1_9FLAO|nr:hypothetical protein [Chryseobacterium endalhagicum]MBL1222135.1 hypothetical protein [Chryseobacterium endalhagicum]
MEAQIVSRDLSNHKISLDLMTKMRNAFLESDLVQSESLNKNFSLSQKCLEFIKSHKECEELILELTEIKGEIELLVSLDRKSEIRYSLFNVAFPVEIQNNEYNIYKENFEKNISVTLDNFIFGATHGLKNRNTRKIFLPRDLFINDAQVVLLPALVTLFDMGDEYELKYFQQLTYIINIKPNNTFEMEEWFDRNGLCPPGC